MKSGTSSCVRFVIQIYFKGLIFLPVDLLFEIFLGSLSHDQMVCYLKAGFCFPMWCGNSRSKKLHCFEVLYSNITLRKFDVRLFICYSTF